jgi:hypothetical protein
MFLLMWFIVCSQRMIIYKEDTSKESKDCLSVDSETKVKQYEISEVKFSYKYQSRDSESVNYIIDNES